MKELKIPLTNKAYKLVNKIVKKEGLKVGVQIEETTLGDTVICIYGPPEEVRTLKDVYEMVK